MNSSEWFLSSPIVAPSDSTQEDNELIELALDIQVPLPTHILDQQLDAVDSEAHKHSDGEDSASSQCLNTQEQGDAETKEEHEIEMICEGWHQQGYRLLRTGIAAPDDTKSFQGTFATSPAGVNLKLFDYQLHALNRILQMFRRNLGALLAYDMGLGKTLIVIALLVVFRDHPAAIYDQFEAEAQHHKPPHSPDRFSKDRLSVKVTHQIFRGKALIVVPFGLLPHWKAELEDRSHPPLKVLVYHGNGRDETTKNVQCLESYDVVLTTYEVIRQESQALATAEETRKKIHCPLFAVYWTLIILEEAHKISNQNNTFARAAYRLMGDYRLALTGTPIQNEYTDCQSLMRFLGIEPWSDVRHFKNYFMRNKRSIDSIVGGAHRLNDILNSILAVTQKAFTIRLRKEDRFNDKPVVTFPLGLQIKKTYPLSPDEARTQMPVITQWDQIRRLNRKEGAWKLAQGELWKAVMAARLSLIHLLCPQARYGGHADEDDEIEDTAEKQTLAERRLEFKEKLRDRQWESSSRLKLTVDGIKEHLANKPGKVLVLCEFLCGLDALDVALSEVGIGVLRYDATLTLKERQKVVNDFGSNGTDMVLLGTIKSAGVGLDFTRATFVVHLSQCWNPATINQGSDRAIRVKQKNQVVVWHLHAEASMDEKMWALREAKMAKAATLLDPTPAMRQAMAEIENWSEDEFVKQLDDYRSIVQERKAEKELKALRKQNREARKAQLQDEGMDFQLFEDAEEDIVNERVASVDYADMADAIEDPMDEDYMQDEQEDEEAGDEDFEEDDGNEDMSL